MDNLYDEFGNYIGPDLDSESGSDDDEEEEEEQGREPESDAEEVNKWGKTDYVRASPEGNRPLNSGLCFYFGLDYTSKVFSGGVIGLVCRNLL